MLDQSMMRRALHAHALIAVGDLRYVSYRLPKSDASLPDFVIMDPVVLADCIDAIIASEVGSTNGKMVHFNVSSKLEDEVELRTIDQDEIVEARIDW